MIRLPKSDAALMLAEEGSIRRADTSRLARKRRRSDEVALPAARYRHQQSDSGEI